MSERSPLVLRTAWLVEPGVWIWEIGDAGGEQVVDSCWTAGWVGYNSEEAAEHAGLGRLAELHAAAGVGGSVVSDSASGASDASIATGPRSPRGRLIVVPRSRATLYRALKRSFEDDANVEVVLDRRFKERRVGGRHHQPDRRGGDRRRRADVDAQLAAGRSVTVPVAVSRARPFDVDGRAILMLCCSEHVVGCRACGKTYRIRWLCRRGLSSFSCPSCGADVTLEIVRHTRVCGYWLGRTAGRTPRTSSQTQASA